jgi:nucleoside-diphosphate-sugar epimerase
MKVLFLGGPGNISRSTIEALCHAGHRITVLTRPGAKTLVREEAVAYERGDRNDAGRLREVCDDFGPDVVVDTICYRPEQARSSIEVFCGRTGQYIFVSTCDVYGYPLSRLPMRESDPLSETRSQYAADKRACEDLFREAADSGAFGLTIVRPSYSLGPKFAISAFSRRGGVDIVCRLRVGREILVPGDGTTLMHASVAVNTGMMLARTVGEDRAIGADYTLGHSEAMTHDDYIHTFARVVGEEPKVVHVPSDLLIEWGVDERTDGLLRELTRYNVQFSEDQFLEHYPDFAWTVSVAEGIRRYVAFQDEHGLVPLEPAFPVEDAAVVVWRKALKGKRLDDG